MDSHGNTLNETSVKEEDNPKTPSSPQHGANAKGKKERKKRNEDSNEQSLVEVCPKPSIDSAFSEEGKVEVTVIDSLGNTLEESSVKEEENPKTTSSPQHGANAKRKKKRKKRNEDSNEQSQVEVCPKTSTDSAFSEEEKVEATVIDSQGNMLNESSVKKEENPKTPSSPEHSATAKRKKKRKKRNEDSNEQFQVEVCTKPSIESAFSQEDKVEAAVIDSHGNTLNESSVKEEKNPKTPSSPEHDATAKRKKKKNKRREDSNEQSQVEVCPKPLINSAFSQEGKVEAAVIDSHDNTLNESSVKEEENPKTPSSPEHGSTAKRKKNRKKRNEDSNEQSQVEVCPKPSIDSTFSQEGKVEAAVIDSHGNTLNESSVKEEENPRTPSSPQHDATAKRKKKKKKRNEDSNDQSQVEVCPKPLLDSAFSREGKVEAAVIDSHGNTLNESSVKEEENPKTPCSPEHGGTATRKKKRKKRNEDSKEQSLVEVCPKPLINSAFSQEGKVEATVIDSHDNTLNESSVKDEDSPKRPSSPEHGATVKRKKKKKKRREDSNEQSQVEVCPKPLINSAFSQEGKVEAAVIDSHCNTLNESSVKEEEYPKTPSSPEHGSTAKRKKNGKKRNEDSNEQSQVEVCPKPSIDSTFSQEGKVEAAVIDSHGNTLNESSVKEEETPRTPSSPQHDATAKRKKKKKKRNEDSNDQSQVEVCPKPLLDSAFSQEGKVEAAVIDSHGNTLNESSVKEDENPKTPCSPEHVATATRKKKRKKRNEDSKEQSLVEVCPKPLINSAFSQEGKVEAAVIDSHDNTLNESSVKDEVNPKTPFSPEHGVTVKRKKKKKKRREDSNEQSQVEVCPKPLINSAFSQEGKVEAAVDSHCNTLNESSVKEEENPKRPSSPENGSTAKRKKNRKKRNEDSNEQSQVEVCPKPSIDSTFSQEGKVEAAVIDSHGNTLNESSVKEEENPRTPSSPQHDATAKRKKKKKKRNEDSNEQSQVEVCPKPLLFSQEGKVEAAVIDSHGNTLNESSVKEEENPKTPSSAEHSATATRKKKRKKRNEDSKEQSQVEVCPKPLIDSAFSQKGKVEATADSASLTTHKHVHGEQHLQAFDPQIVVCVETDDNNDSKDQSHVDSTFSKEAKVEAAADSARLTRKHAHGEQHLQASDPQIAVCVEIGDNKDSNEQSQVEVCPKPLIDSAFSQEAKVEAAADSASLTRKHVHGEQHLRAADPQIAVCVETDDNKESKEQSQVEVCPKPLIDSAFSQEGKVEAAADSASLALKHVHGEQHLQASDPQIAVCVESDATKVEGAQQGDANVNGVQKSNPVAALSIEPTVQTGQDPPVDPEQMTKKRKKRNSELENKGLESEKRNADLTAETPVQKTEGPTTEKSMGRCNVEQAAITPVHRTESLRDTKSPLKQHGESSLYCEVCQMIGHSLQECVMLRTLSKRELVCFFCREIGHSLANCGVSRAGGRFAKCLLCYEHGHFSFNCPLSEKEEKRKELVANGDSSRTVETEPQPLPEV